MARVSKGKLAYLKDQYDQLDLYRRYFKSSVTIHIGGDPMAHIYRFKPKRYDQLMPRVVLNGIRDTSNREGSTKEDVGLGRITLSCPYGPSDDRHHQAIEAVANG